MNNSTLRKPLFRWSFSIPVVRLLGFLVLLNFLSGHAWAQCTAPTGLAVTNVAAGTATLSFAGPAAATSYTVSYTFVGGTTATTVSPNPTSSPVQLSGLPFSAGVTVSVTANCGGGQTSPTATVTFQSAAGNDEPCQAFVLPVTSSCTSPLAGTTVGATPTPANGYAQQGCGGDASPRDVWYAVTTAATGAASTGLTVTVAGNTAGQVRLFSAASCTGPFTALACVAGSSFGNGQAPPLVVAGLSPSTTYYVRVAGYFGYDPQGAFTICASNPPTCGDPINLAVSNITATAAQLTFTPGPGNTSYTVTVTPQNGATTTLPVATGSPVALPNLTPLTTYTVSLRATCANGALGTYLTTTFTTGNGNDDPATAVPLAIAATCQSTAGTTQGATTTTPNGYTNPGCGGPNLQTNDVWFSFQTAATGLASTGATVTVTGTAAGQVRVFSSPGGATGPFTEVGCSATAFNTVAAPLVVAGLSPSTTYYISVADYNFSGSSGGVFSICLTPPPACPAPTRLAAGSLTTASAQLSWVVPSPGGAFSVEYGLTGFVPGSAAGTVVSAGNATSFALTGLAANTSYDFYVTRDCGTAGPSARSGPVTFRTAQVPGPANDAICAAFALPNSGATCTAPTQGTTVGATPSNILTAVGSATCAGAGALDVYYQFTTAASGPASIGATLTLNGATSLNVLAAAACGGPYTQVGGDCSNANGVNPNPVVVLGLTPSTTYYVQVAISPFDTQRAFTLCRTDPPACNVPSGLFFPTAFLGATSAVLNFTPGSGNTGYTVTVTGPGGFTQTQSATTSPVTITGLTASTTYTLSLLSNCAGGQGVPVTATFTTAPAGPANQTCAGAFPIACGQTLQGTTVNAFGFNGIPSCGTTSSVVYRFAGTGDMVDVDMCNTTTSFFSTQIIILSGSCGSLTCVPVIPSPVACAIRPANSTYRFQSLVGTTYYIVAGSGGSAPGTFGLTVTCIPPPCPSPASVAVTNLTPTAASVAFTPAAGSSAPAYTVTATPVGGGAAVTATGAASPIALTGLSANTSYSVVVAANCTPTTASAASAAVTIRTPLASRNAALAEQISLYPNPAHRSTTLVVPAALLRQAGLLTVIDGLGRVVQQRFVSPTPGRTGEIRAELSLTDLPAGVYTLRLLSSEGPLTKQLVVE